MQLQFENGVGLLGRERFFSGELGSAAGGVDINLFAAEIGDQVLASIGTIRARANNRDDVIEVIERGEIAFENVLAILRLRQQVGGAPAHDIDAMVDEVLERLNE